MLIADILVCVWVNLTNRTCIPPISNTLDSPSLATRTVTHNHSFTQLNHPNSPTLYTPGRLLKRIKNLRRELKKIFQNKELTNFLDEDFPLQNIYKYFENNISIESQEILNSIFLEHFPELINDLCNAMGTVEENTVPISYNVKKLIEVIKKFYSERTRAYIDASNNWFNTSSKTN